MKEEREKSWVSVVLSLPSLAGEESPDCQQGATHVFSVARKIVGFPHLPTAQFSDVSAFFFSLY